MGTPYLSPGWPGEVTFIRALLKAYFTACFPFSQAASGDQTPLPRRGKSSVANWPPHGNLALQGQYPTPAHPRPLPT
jgi:hypothetical protein